jgi:protein N-terminal methyltransferase
VNGVLGGYGTGVSRSLPTAEKSSLSDTGPELTPQPVPHIEQLSSRLFLLSLLPALHTFASPLTPSPVDRPAHRLTALDVGAGIGRVTQHVLLPLFDDVVVLEPVDKFIREAHRSASAGEWRDLPKLGKQPSDDGSDMDRWKEDERKVNEMRKGRGKRILCVKGGLQGLDPAYPVRGDRFESVGVVGEAKAGQGAELGAEEEEVMYDVSVLPVLVSALLLSAS